MNPILKYPGAKWRLAEWIISYMPHHTGYIEPFAGSLAVLLNKTPARVETANDIDGLVINFFRVVRERPEELARAIELTPWARAEYDASDDPTDCEVERARRFAVRCAMAYGSVYASKTGWRHSKGADKKKTQNTPYLNTWGKIPDAIIDAAQRLKGVQFENRPAVDVIRMYDGPDMLVYADPPYVRETRTANVDQYRHEMTDKEHESLLDVLKQHSGMVLLSGYDCELYRDYLLGWKVEKYKTRADSGGERTECLWLNSSVIERSGQVMMEVCR